VAAFSAIFMFNTTTFDIVVPVEVDGFITFDALSQVSQYDITFRWFDFLQASILQRAMQVLSASSLTEVISILTLKLATVIYNTHKQYCTGPNQQYANHITCMDFFTHDIRFGASIIPCCHCVLTFIAHTLGQLSAGVSELIIEIMANCTILSGVLFLLLIVMQQCSGQVHVGNQMVCTACSVLAPVLWEEEGPGLDVKGINFNSLLPKLLAAYEATLHPPVVP
jgi:hypothetical protein